MTENFYFLFKYLKKEKINIDQTEFNFQVQSHSSFPSLLAISDTLSFLKINNIATKLDNEDIEHLPDSFIALLKKKEQNFLAFIERIENGFQYTENGKPVFITQQFFQEIFQNVVLLAEAEDIEFKTKKTNKLLISGIVFACLLYFVSIFITGGYSLLTILFICFAALGTYLSIEAISNEFGVKTIFSEAVCTITTNTDCDAVINSKKSKLLQLFSFSDASISFFGSQIIALLLFSVSNKTVDFYNISTLLLILSAPLTLFSLYLQKIIAKKWCPVCLLIIALIYGELCSLFVLNDFTLNISIISIIYYSIILIVSFLICIVVKNMIKENLDLKSKVGESNRFKRNYSLFKMALLASPKLIENTNNSGQILLGNLDAKIKIILISSPFCSYCKKAHNVVEEILKQYNDKVCINFRFNFDYEKSDDKSKRIHKKLIQIYFNEGQDTFLNALHNWFENNNEDYLGQDTNSNELEIYEILHNQFLSNKESKINYTPAIILNDYLYPNEYNNNDLIYFISDLENDEDFGTILKGV